MNIRYFLACSLSLSISLSTYAKPGTPIGGVIVKGGKNPGGQMLVQTTTDTGGKFTLTFTEGGEYQISFDQSKIKMPAAQAKTAMTEKMNASLSVDYAVSTTGSTSRHTPIHKKIDSTAILIKVPNGGGTLNGTVSQGDTATDNDASERAINESGVSVKSDPKKGVKK
ncbi:hypothetical protein [Undibacterium sp.]|uniref:hypothetical protein n=1 Tax=Undibacterium sp. TaxID=1914977 RepID=UPI003752098E